MSKAIVVGSLQAIANQNNQSLAETFLNADVIVIVDTSGSMSIDDSRGGKKRYDVACQELAQLQANLPGKIGVIAFSNSAVFCPGGQPMYLGGSTEMDTALKFAKAADVEGMQFILISDGQPDSPAETLNVARTFKNKISTIFVGPEGGHGEAFLAQLAQVGGGQAVKAEKAQELAAVTTYLLGQ